MGRVVTWRGGCLTATLVVLTTWSLAVLAFYYRGTITRGIEWGIIVDQWKG
jgi:hypothetical protein